MCVHLLFSIFWLTFHSPIHLNFSLFVFSSRYCLLSLLYSFTPSSLLRALMSFFGIGLHVFIRTKNDNDNNNIENSSNHGAILLPGEIVLIGSCSLARWHALSFYLFFLFLLWCNFLLRIFRNNEDYL